MIRRLVILIVLCILAAALPTLAKVNKKTTNDKYIVYGTMRCPYTVKMVDELKSKNVEYAFVDVSTEEGNAAFSKAAPDTDGVPFTVNTTTGKSFLGYRTI